MIGRTISHYKVLEKLGEGGMGVVYKAEDIKLNRSVALKFLSSQPLDTPEAKSRFVTEARAAAALDHPNICAVHGIDEVDGHTFIAMTYCDGESLRERVSRGPLSLQDTVRWGIDIARGLQEAHEAGIIHRDIKSANVMITGKGQVKITDFGLAKLADSTRVTKTGTMLGTAAYMSPEQVGCKTVDRRSDIWSLGVILYEMLTGRLPFVGEHEQAVAYQIIHEEAEPITAIRSGVPLELERIVNKCLAKDTSDRYQHVDDLLVDLRHAEDRPSPKVSKKSRSPFVLPALLALMAAVVLAVWQPFRGSDGGDTFENPLTEATFRRLTNIQGTKDAAISPDGQFVAFVSDHDGEFDVWVSQVETGNIYNRTRGESGDMRRGLQDVGFSASGSEILSFAISSKQPVQSMPLLDGPLRNALRDSVIMASWSPDGSRVVYFTDGEGDPVFVADADGTNNREILGSEAGTHQHYPRWSLDGEWIYMTRGRDAVWDTDLWRVRSDGSQLEQLTEDQLDVVYPAPISDRVVLFIARDRDGAGPWIWAVDVKTKACQRVSIGTENYNSLSASRDGRRLATAVIDPDANALTVWSVPILNTIATESDVKSLALPVRPAQAPRFGGRVLYFLSSRGSGDGLWKYEDGRVEEVWGGARAALLEVPIISRDGETIAIALRREGQRHLHLISSDGSNLHLLTDSIDVRGTGSFSPDGKWIAVGGYDDHGQGLFKISVDDGHYERITAEDAVNPVWSPRSDLIVYAGRQVSGFSTILAVRPDGEKVDLPEIKVWMRDERFRFMPDGSGLVYMKGWFVGQNYWLLDIASMESRQLTKLAAGATSQTFDISPDARSIVFDRVQVKSEIVLIELPDDEAGE